jgi:alpha-amylase
MFEYLTMGSVLLLVLLAVVGPLATADNKDPNFASGRTTILEMFEWRWDDLAEECENFLGPYGVGGIQVSPIQEHVIITDPSRPWYELYQPIDLTIVTRSGDETTFTDMVQRCNAVDVRVYVDLVMNNWGTGSGTGVGGSSYDGDDESYPVWSSNDFHSCDVCGTSSCNIESYQDASQVRNCRLDGMPDLDQSTDYVRSEIAAFLNKLIGIGVAGFRIDAAKHMWPDDLSAIYDMLDNLNTAYFDSGAEAFIYQEVIQGAGEPVTTSEYTPIGRVLEFDYPEDIGQVFRKMNNQQLSYLVNFGEGWGMDAGSDVVVFVCNHDDQRGQSGDIDTTITFFDADLYKRATAFMLAWPYGVPRVMVSYYWDRDIVNDADVNYWVGPPTDDGSDISPVEYNDDLSCQGDWECEHRWRQIYNMIRFRNAVGEEDMTNWWDNGANQIAFGRGSSGFIAINNDDSSLTQSLPTGMAEGTYCDVISGNLEDGACTGLSITVDSTGYVSLDISNDQDDPMIAIHINAKLS